jgi:hypothetical protein
MHLGIYIHIWGLKIRIIFPYKACYCPEYLCEQLSKTRNPLLKAITYNLSNCLCYEYQFEQILA